MEICFKQKGNKRLWVHSAFQQDTRLLCQEAQCSPELWWNYGSCEYNKQSGREKKSELRETNFDCFCQGAQCPPELWWNYPYIWPHTSRAPATSWHFPPVIKPAYKVYQSAFHPVTVYCSCKQQKKSLCPGKHFLELSFCQFASFCQSLWSYNLFCKYCCTASRRVLFTTRHMHHLPPSCDGEHACTGIYRVDLLSWLKAMCDC